MRLIKALLIVALAVAFSVWFSSSADGQLGGLKDKAKKKAEEKAKQEAQKKTENSDKSDDENKASSEEPAGNSEQSENENTPPPTASGKLGEGVWVNYDFVPGDRVLFFDDYSEDVVGNFPQRLELLEGNLETAEWKGRRWLRATTYGEFLVPLPKILPSRFTLEFDLYAPYNWNVLSITGTESEPGVGNGKTEAAFSPWGTRAGVRKSGNAGDLAMTEFPEKLIMDILHCRVMADGKYMKVYVNELRVANFPNTNFTRSSSLTFNFAADPDHPLMIADIRVAASDKKMYDALVADGHVATHGILFDSGSDKIRPESTPTLKEIGDMLKAHADLSLMIEGHTDNVGDDASNQSLSDRRAAAVRQYMIDQYGIDGARLQAKGYGETKPVSSNDTPEGRQNNRRVELVKT